MLVILAVKTPRAGQKSAFFGLNSTIPRWLWQATTRLPVRHFGIARNGFGVSLPVHCGPVVLSVGQLLRFARETELRGRCVSGWHQALKRDATIAHTAHS
jgi:hypothetical protein